MGEGSSYCGREPQKIGGMRQEGKGQEVGVLRGREAGEKYKTLVSIIY